MAEGKREHKFIKEFREFISRGNMMDMAVGIIIGGAFTAIVNSLVTDIITPILGIFIGGIDFSKWVVTIPSPYGGTIDWTIGNFINAVIDFLLIALVVFLLIKGINKLHKKDEPAPAKKAHCPYCKEEIAEGATRCPHCTAELPKPAQLDD